MHQLWILALAIAISIAMAMGDGSRTSGILRLRGGLVPQANDGDAGDYYEKFELDYGVDDTKRNAGAMRGFFA